MSLSRQGPDARTLLSRARALIDLGRHDDAADLLDSVQADDPDLSGARALQAFALLQMGKPSSALRCAELAAAAEPSSAAAQRLRSLALLDLRKRRAALAAAHQAVRLGPDHAFSWIALADAYLGQQPQRLRRARKAAEQALKVDPTEAQAHNALGRVALARGWWKGAERHFAAGLAIEPGHSGLLGNYALALDKRGRHLDAYEIHAQASQLDPNTPRHRENAAVAASNHVSGRALLAVLGLAQLARVTGEDRSLASAPWPILVLLLLAALGLALMTMARRRGLPDAARAVLRSRRRVTWNSETLPVAIVFVPSFLVGGFVWPATFVMPEVEMYRTMAIVTLGLSLVTGTLLIRAHGRISRPA